MLEEIDLRRALFISVLFAFFELVVIGWVFGMEHHWKQIHLEAEIRVTGIVPMIV